MFISSINQCKEMLPIQRSLINPPNSFYKGSQPETFAKILPSRKEPPLVRERNLQGNSHSLTSHIAQESVS